jgi:hypothetical protein
MEKLVYLISHAAEQGAEWEGSGLRGALLHEAVPALRAGGAFEISVNVQDEATAAGSPIHHLDPPIRAMVSFWMHDAYERRRCEAALAKHGSKRSGYLVVESRPLRHDPLLGRRTPGFNQVTCVSRRADLHYAEFTRIWHEEHRAVAIETQSTTGYVRNEVVRALTPDAIECDGIVEETFPIEALTNPQVFYDAHSKDEFRANLARMLESCQRFLDLDKIESTHMSEYYLGSSSDTTPNEAA